MKVLRLPDRRVKPPAPQNALLPVVSDSNGEPVVDFSDVLTWSRSHLFSAVSALHGTLLDLSDLAAVVSQQSLWCMAPLTENFKVSNPFPTLRACMQKQKYKQRLADDVSSLIAAQRKCTHHGGEVLRVHVDSMILSWFP